MCTEYRVMSSVKLVLEENVTDGFEKCILGIKKSKDYWTEKRIIHYQ